MKRLKNIAIVAAVIAAVVDGCQSNKNVDMAEEQMPVDVAEVVTDSVILYRTYPGTLTANNTVQVVARVNGTLQSVHFSGGDLVKKGQLLFTIEDRTYRDAVNQAEAQLETARSTHEFATKQYLAMKKALESDAVSQIDVIQAKSSMEESAASIQNAEAALSTARQNLAYCSVTAPITGHITSNAFSPGTYLAGAGSLVTLATIYDDATLNANFYLEDASFLRMFGSDNNRSMIDYEKVPLQFTEALPHTYTGNLKYMAPAVNSSTGTMLVQAGVDNKYGELRDGMYVEVRLPWKVDPKAMLVKDAAISTDQLGKYLYVVNDSDNVVYTPIKAGDVYRDTMRVVYEGVVQGEKYVTKALLRVRNGMQVKPVVE